jgi:hypothetical protein
MQLHLISLFRRRPRKECSADRLAELMRFREPVSAYLHFIKTTSRRWPDINLNPKRHCEFCGLRLSGLGERDDADADAPAVAADPQLSAGAGHKDETAFRYLATATTVLPCEITFSSGGCFRHGVSAREPSCLHLHEYKC